MKKLLMLVAVLFSLSSSIAQGFIGSIEFKYRTEKDTTVNIYQVKNKLIRLDQYGRKGNLDASFIFDLGANEVKWVNPKRKLWGYVKSETPQVVRGQCVVTKGSATKTIAGVKCVEYTVKNTEENTLITYWIAEGKYTFFVPLLKLYNGKTKQVIYFAQIKGLPEGSMPMLSEEKNLADGRVLTSLEATKLVNTPPADAVYAIPEGYTKFEN